ncbi:hypothetical protein BS47DRAFT_1292727 [Hydnum rufescens UP504]|uniref:Uncharacterized protein n=1 Tax=Hydnum rufescens UP504 TaxID=1448309 RepID=A0A9P6B221_9AGAM|nr:hypothetical protein BS47DRAFT_1292727 [Hydnum rufescens UP504]
MHNLSTAEAHLQFGQAMEALTKLWQAICIKAHLIRYKHTEVHGQRPNTHAHALLDRVKAHIDVIVESYCAAQQAYYQLTGPGTWENTLNILHVEDIHAITDTKAPSNNGQLVKMGVDTTDSPEMHEGMTFITSNSFLHLMDATLALCVEWVKCCACKNQWTEEVLLLQEELHWAIAFSKFKGAKWDAHSSAHSGLTLDLLDSIQAYANQHWMWM